MIALLINPNGKLVLPLEHQGAYHRSSSSLCIQWTVSIGGFIAPVIIATASDIV